MEQIQKNDVGISFIIIVQNGSSVEDISQYDTLQIIFTKPDGVTLTKEASLYSDGTDGKMMYNSQEGDLDTVGFWQIQGYLATTLVSYHTEIGRFRIHRNLS